MKPILLALGCLLLVASPGWASAAPVPLADSVGGYWSNFVSFWSSKLGSQSGVIWTVLGVGAFALFIITRGKWRK